MSEFTEIGYNQHQVVCESPRIIINPLLPDLINKYHHWFIKGKEFYDTRRHINFFEPNLARFSVKYNEITHDDLASCYVLDGNSGETFPIYIEVPCNHCDICNCKKHESMVRRCLMETQSHDSLPWFVTLTYDPNHIPKDGISKRELQLWFKRLRISLVRAGYPFRIRYIACGEYGTKTHRPHYHVFIWNIQSYTKSQFEEIHNLIECTWKRGFIKVRLCDPSSNKNTIKYTLKYMCKGSVSVPQGCNPPFILSSRGHGGLGAWFLDSIKDNFYKVLSPTFSYKDKFTSDVVPIVFDQYVLNRLLPSWSKSVPAVLRQSLAKFSLSVCASVHEVSNNLLDKYFEIKDKFSDFCYFVKDSTLNLPLRLLGEFPLEQTCSECLPIINKYMSLDLKRCFDLNVLRQKFLNKLFANHIDIDVAYRSYQCRRYIQVGITHEVL